MNSQMTFADIDAPDEGETDWEKFKRIHTDKPEIYSSFCDFTRTLIDRGYPRYSAYGVMHIVRFHTYKPGVDMRPEEEHKISNNMTPFYARLFVRDNPDDCEFFSLRRKKMQGFQEEWINEI